MTVRILTINGVDATLGGLVETTADWNTLRGRTRSRQNSAFTRSGAGARFTGSTYPVDQITLTHKIVTPAGQRESTLELLEARFYPPFAPAAADDAWELVFEQNGVEKSVRVAPVALAEHPQNSGPTCQESGWYQGTWEIYDPVAYATSETTTSDSPPTVSVPVLGTVASSRVEYDIETTVAKDKADGQTTRRLVTVANRSARPWVRRPLLLTPGGWDHAAAVLAGESITTGDDVEVYAAGRRIPAWSDNWDNAATLVWTALDLPAGRSWTLAAGASSGASTFQVLEPLLNLPGDAFYIMSEAGNCWRVTSWDAEAGTFTVDDAARDTSAEALTAGDLLWWVAPQGVIDLVWGWTGAPAPAYDAADEPIIDLATSTNTAWSWDEYYEPIGGADNVGARVARPGAWLLRSLGAYDREFYSGDGDQYWRIVPQSNGTPGTALALDYNPLGAIAGRPLADRWDLESPVGIATVGFAWDASNIRWAGASPPLKVGRLAAILIDADGNEIIGGEYDLDVTSGSGTDTLSPTVPVHAVSFRYQAYDRKLDPPQGAALEPSTGEVWQVDTITVTFDTSETPLVAFPASEHTIYQVGRPDAPATLATTLGTLEILGAIVDAGDTLTIAAEDRAATPDTVRGVANYGHLLRGVVPDVPPDLSAYPTAGTADVVYSEADATGLTITVRHRDAWN